MSPTTLRSGPRCLFVSVFFFVLGVFQELKHGRTAMIGITGMYFQTLVQGEGILSQLGQAFSTPEAVSKAGYYFNPL